MNDQDLARVNTNIAPHVLAFVNARIGREFRMVELYQYVWTHTQGYTAPASADRILRALKSKGEIDYIVLNRRQSLYLAKAVQGQGVLF